MSTFTFFLIQHLLFFHSLKAHGSESSLSSLSVERISFPPSSPASPAFPVFPTSAASPTSPTSPTSPASPTSFASPTSPTSPASPTSPTTPQADSGFNATIEYNDLDDEDADSILPHRRCSDDHLIDVNWTLTDAGVLALQPCPQPYSGSVYRPCYSSGSWGDPDYTECRLEHLREIQSLVCNYRNPHSYYKHYKHYYKHLSIDNGINIYFSLGTLSKFVLFAVT